MGTKGRFAGGVLSFGIPRAEAITDHGMTLTTAQGVAEAINFQEAGTGKVATTGDFVLTAEEVNPVISALEEHDVAVTALHRHMLTEQPRLFFMHFWAVGSTESVAREALNGRFNRDNEVRSSGNQTPKPDSIPGDSSKPDKLCNRAVLRSIAGALDVQPLDSAARNLCGLQVHAFAVSSGPSWCSILPNRDHRLDRSLTGGLRISVGATGGHQVASANLAGARGAGNVLGTLDRVSANWRNAFEPTHSSHPGSWRRGLARLGVLRRAYGDNPL